MARVVEKRNDGALIVEVPAGDAAGLEVGADVEVRRKDRAVETWPEPFGQLSGAVPDISIDDIKAARRDALVGDDLA